MYFLVSDLTLFAHHAINGICTHILIVVMCLGGFEGNEDRMIGGDEGEHRVSLQGESTKTSEIPSSDWQG